MRKILFIFLCVATWQTTYSQHVSQLHFTSVPGTTISSLDFYHNRFLVIDFWATWCGPCIAAMPHLQELEQSFAQDSSVVFATITAESATTVHRFLKGKSLPLTKHPLMDTTKQSWETFKVDAIPLTLIFSPEGNVIFRGNPKQLTRELLTSIMQNESVILPVESEKTPEKFLQNPRYLFKIYDADSILSAPEYNTSMTAKNFTFSGNEISVQDCFVSLSNCSPLRLVTNDSLRFNSHFACEAWLEHSLIPQIQERITGDTLTDAFFSELATCFRFKAEWTSIKTRTLELVILGETIPESAETNSTYGKSSSYDENILSLINYSPADLVLELEKTDLLQLPVYTRIRSEKKYDFILDITNETTLMESLKTHGMQLHSGGKRRVKMLRVCFQ